MISNDISKVLEVKNKFNFFLIMFAFIWLFVFFSKLDIIDQYFLKQNFETIALGIVLYVVTIYLIYQVIWTSFGSKTFRVIDNSFIITSGALFLKTTRKYSINGISNMEMRSDIDSSNYWGVLGIRFYGKKAVMAFKYNKQDVTLNSNLSSDQFEEIKKWMK